MLAVGQFHEVCGILIDAQWLAGKLEQASLL